MNKQPYRHTKPHNTLPYHLLYLKI